MSWLSWLDRTLFDALYAGPTPGTAYSLMLALTVLGTGWTLLAIVPFGLVPRTRRVASELLAVLLVVTLVVFLVKIGVHRTRPFVEFGLEGYGLAVSKYQSFPSGHAAGSFTFASFLTFRTRLPRVMPPLLFTLATWIALSRVYLGVHYPSDIAAGALLGTVMGGWLGHWSRVRHQSPGGLRCLA